MYASPSLFSKSSHYFGAVNPGLTVRFLIVPSLSDPHRVACFSEFAISLATTRLCCGASCEDCNYL